MNSDARSEDKALGSLRREWNEFANFVVSFVFDVARGTLILLSLYFFGWLLHFGKSIGMDQDHLEMLERVHFWANFSAYFIISLDFMWRLTRSVFAKRHQ